MFGSSEIKPTNDLSKLSTSTSISSRTSIKLSKESSKSFSVFPMAKIALFLISSETTRLLSGFSSPSLSNHCLSILAAFSMSLSGVISVPIIFTPYTFI